MIRQGQALSLVRGNMRRKHQTLIGMAVLTLVMTSRSAVAQEAAFGASLQPRIVEGESQKPPGPSTSAATAARAVQRDTSFISIRSVTRLTGGRKAFPTSPFQSRVGPTKRRPEPDRRHGRTVEPAPRFMA